MNSKKKMARVSGLLYLIIVLTGIFSLMYVPAKLIVHGDASATAKNILASQLLFRANILNSLVSPTVAEECVDHSRSGLGRAVR